MAFGKGYFATDARRFSQIVRFWIAARLAFPLEWGMKLDKLFLRENKCVEEADTQIRARL